MAAFKVSSGVGRVVVSPVLVAALVTVAPAMVTVWWFLKQYEGAFEDARVFFSLTVGFFAGLATAAFELFTGFASPTFQALVGVGTAFLFFVVGYAFLETGVKTIVLGLRRFRGRRDTPYYGAALGLGMGAMLAMMLIANALRRGDLLGTPYDAATFTPLAVLFIGTVFAHGATGAWVGKGSADGKLWKGWAMGTMLQAPILGALWLYWPNLGRGDLPWFASLFPVLFTVGYGVLLLLITKKQVLDAVVPRDIMLRVRRDRRREARRKALVGDSEEE